MKQELALEKINKITVFLYFLEVSLLWTNYNFFSVLYLVSVDAPQVAVAVTREDSARVQHGNVVVDQHVTPFSRVQAHAAVAQQRAH